MAVEPQIGEFEGNFGVKIDMNAIMKEVYEAIDKYILLTHPPVPEEPKHTDKVEFDIDQELRDDLSGLARYVAKEIEQEDCDLRERVVFAALNEFELDSNFFDYCTDIFNYIKTGKHE